jgi:hypothetical protein
MQFIGYFPINNDIFYISLLQPKERSKTVVEFDYATLSFFISWNAI